MESMLYQGHRFLGGIKHFLDGRESGEDKLRCGRPCTSKTDKNVTKVRDLVRTVRMTSSVLNLNRQTVHDLEKGFIVSGQRLRTLGCCITTMLRHTAISVKEFMAKKGVSVVPQPPYSPDQSPCDFFLFPKLKFHLKGRHFWTVDNVQKVMTDQLRALLHEDFQHCYRK